MAALAVQEEMLLGMLPRITMALGCIITVGIARSRETQENNSKTQRMGKDRLRDNIGQ